MTKYKRKIYLKCHNFFESLYIYRIYSKCVLRKSKISESYIVSISI